MSTSAEEQEDQDVSSDEESSAEADDIQIGDETFQVSQKQPSSSRTSMCVSVHRGEIAAAPIQEGIDELQGLDVSAYDRQVYEESVFDQVDRAITSASGSTVGHQSCGVTNSPENINDLMRVIQNEGATNQNDGSSQARDEEVLMLARQERLNRVRIKQEFSGKEPDVIESLPRIPRVSSKNSPRVAQDIKPSIGQIFKHEPQSTGAPVSSSDQESASEEQVSSGDEYQAEQQDLEIDEDLDDVDYATDDEVENPRHDSDSSSDERPRKNSATKKINDDGDFRAYSKRIKSYTKQRAKMRFDNILADGTELKNLDETVTIEGNLQILKETWDNLYEHQRTGVRWLWELHQLGTGGILGDEMGLGKTIQMVAFLIALKTSNIISAHSRYENLGPVVLVCPATVMHQWLQEFRKWYPPFRVAILHSTGSFTGDRKQLVRVIHKANGILICSYSGVAIYQDYLHALDWHYAILDEGHKIRNPDAQVSLACKRFRTPHRIILSGSPVQNNLRELWSIFDFIYPGKLGTLPVFMGHFGIPITQGGYANATDMQVQIAYKCACVLRDTIKPFLLRRTKAEVNDRLKLPERSEQVLFCKLTERQRKLYEIYIQSPTVRDIKRGVCQIFVGLIQLRKICNHPDLFDATECIRQVKETQKFKEDKIKHLEFFSTDETYGHKEKSGKMMVVDALLKLWKEQKHKVLLFTQSRQMLKIFMNYLTGQKMKYLWMDGSIPLATRHTMIDSFNTDDEIFIFLLTTRVGGVGINLIGANRIIIYDPDWNPSTDIQARERAWRIGQKRNVVIYRLLTAGTIEEKIYHRQVFKLYLTNRILKDAKQKRFFKTNDMHELFTLGRDDNNIETKALFDDDLQINEDSIKNKRSKKKKKKKDRKHKKRKVPLDENSTESIPTLTEEKLKEMRERAKRLSQMIACQYGDQRVNHTQVKAEKIEGEISVTIPRIETNSIIDNVKSDELLLDDVADQAAAQPIPYCPAFGVQVPCESAPKVSISSPKTPKISTKQRVDYLVKQDIYRPTGGSSKDYEHDDYILGRLFKNSNITGALKHDRIEGDSTADFKVVESEAEKVARDAIRVLRESRRSCLSSTSGIPNWTGRNGQVATQPRLVPRNKARAQQIISRIDGPSCESNGGDSLLSSIRKRNQVNPVHLRTGQEDPLASDDDEGDKDFAGRAGDVGADQMAQKIRDFVLYRSAVNGEAQTDELLDFFRNNFDAKKTAVFKAILYKICELQRRGNKGFWKLKSEYRDL